MAMKTRRSKPKPRHTPRWWYLILRGSL